MKQSMIANFRRIVAILMSMVMCLLFTTEAFAEEANAVVDETTTKLELISENSSITREEALNILGITEDELGNGNLYVMDVPVSLDSENKTVIMSQGQVEDLGSINFEGDATGGTLIAFETDTSQARFAVVSKWLNPDSRSDVILDVTLVNGTWSEWHTTSSASGFGDGSVKTKYSEWFPISSDYTYHFEYDARLGYWVEPIPVPQITAHVVIAAV